MGSIRIRNYWDRLSSTLWFVPAGMTLAGIGLALGAIAFDRALKHIPEGWFFLYSGGAEGARSVLSTTAGSMITVAGVAFSATMVALSFASSQLGPRLLRNFMRDRGNQVVLGTFISTFVYCLLVLRTVRETPPEFVPHAGVTAGLVLALASLAVLIYFIHHVAMTLQADYVISMVARDLDRSIERMYPGSMGEGATPEQIEPMKKREAELRGEEAVHVKYPSAGYVHALDLAALMRLAEKRDLLIRVLARPGCYLHDGATVAELWPASSVDDRLRRKVASAFVAGRMRTSEQDVQFAINQLVEVAVRALSSGVNDPFTAISCIDRLSTGVLHMMRREFPTRFRVDGEGVLRVIAEGPDFADVVDASFHQIRQSGAALPAVTIHLLAALTSLLEHATTAEHRRVINHHVELVRRAGVRETADVSDRNDIIDRALVARYPRER